MWKEAPYERRKYRMWRWKEQVRRGLRKEILLEGYMYGRRTVGEGHDRGRERIDI